MNSTAAPRTASDSIGWASWAALAALWLCFNPFLPLLDPDEARYAEIPREMVANGDWVTPRLNDLKYFEKPPLQLWATAGLYRVFGEHNGTARFWALSLSFLCIPLVFGWVKRFYGPRAGHAALLVLATSPLFVLAGHLNLLDGAFTFWISATVFAFAAAQMQPVGSRGERNYMCGVWAAAALGVLSKGIIVPALAGLTLITYSLVQRDWQAWRRLHLALGLPLFAAIAAPWFIAVDRANPEFARFFFLHEHFERFLTTIHKHGEPWWFFLPILALALLPWLHHTLAAMRTAWRSAAGASTSFHPLRFFLIYAAVVMVFFSISQSKLPPYILPVLPPMAAVIGIHLAERGRFARSAAWVSAAMVAVVAMGLVIYAARRYDSPPIELATWCLIAVIAAAAPPFIFRRDRSVRVGAIALAATSIVAWQSLMAAYSTPPMTRSASGLVAQVQAHIDASTRLYSVGQYRPSISFYLRRTLQLVDYQGEMDFGLQQEPGRNCATRAEFIREWRQNASGIAFFDARIWHALTADGFPGRVIARDRYSIVVSRQ